MGKGCRDDGGFKLKLALDCTTTSYTPVVCSEVTSSTLPPIESASLGYLRIRIW